MDIRPYTAADLDGVLRLCALEGWPSLPQDPARAGRVLTAPGVTTLVAAEDGQVVGFAQIQSDGEIQAHLSLIAVDPTFRRRGVARDLIVQGLAAAGGLRLDLITEAAEGFYAAMPHFRQPGFRLYPRYSGPDHRQPGLVWIDGRKAAAGRAAFAIGRADPRDAARLCEVVRRSIAELCVEDHRNDAAILAAWLDNKTPDHMAQWIANPANTLLACREGEAILGVGCLRDVGEITLNYVSPDARFRGVSSAMVAALEAAAREQGHAVCGLDSTVTARRFYLGQGYQPNGPAGEKFGLTTYPMTKRL